jgi:hypothetical protein
MIQRELTRRYVDFSMVDVRVIHGVCYLRGTMRQLRSHPEVDLETEAEVIRKILRQKPGIRDVVWEVQAIVPSRRLAVRKRVATL